MEVSLMWKCDQEQLQVHRQLRNPRNDEKFLQDLFVYLINYSIVKVSV